MLHLTWQSIGSLSKTYTEEKAELNAKIADLILQENSAKDAYQKINRLYEAIEKYDSITELTSEVLSDFVDRIEVGEHLKGTKEQKIDVFFVGVGLMDTLWNRVPHANYNYFSFLNKIEL